MSKKDGKTGKKTGLFKSRAKKEESIDKVEDVAANTEEQLEHITPAAPAMPDEETTFRVSEGALLRAWYRYKGGELTMYLSLDPQNKLPLEKSRLTRERVRLMAQLERDAKRYMNGITAAEEGRAPKPGAMCCAYLSADGMVAWAILFPPMDAEEALGLDVIVNAMASGGITSGIDSNMVTSMYQNPRYFELFALAVGTPAIEGVDGSIIERFPRAPEAEVKINADGNADYRSQNYVQAIKKDDVICDIILPVQGTAGMRVDGKAVMPKNVKPAKIPRGSNTAVTEDGLSLVAVMDGHLVYSGSSFSVKPILDIDGDVDYSTGNIDYHGDVHIRGDIRENFSVHATGSITVEGLVEAANVEAGGDILISSGVLGDNRALIKSRGTIRAKYLENCVVFAGKCVYADCIITSQVYSDDSIEVTSGRGTVIGGSLTAANSIKAKIIGSQSGRKTELELGILPYVQEQLQNDEEDMRRIHREMAELEKELAYLEGQGMDANSSRLAKTHLRKSVLEMKIEKIVKRRQTLQPISPMLDRCRLECSIIYPVAHLKVQNASYYFKTVHNHCRAGYDVAMEEIKLI